MELVAVACGEEKTMLAGTKRSTRPLDQPMTNLALARQPCLPPYSELRIMELSASAQPMPTPWHPPDGLGLGMQLGLGLWQG